MKFTYIDKENLCVYTDGSIQKLESEYILRYRENLKRDKRNKEWKKNTDAMMYDDYFFEGESIIVSMYSISPTLEENKILYSFSVNETSGVYYKYTDDEKKTEAHFITSSEENFKDILMNRNGVIVGTVQKDPLTADIAVFSPQGGDYKCITGGDSLDENPFAVENGVFFYNSYGIGRDMNNDFVQYIPSEILKINTRSMEVETVISDEKNSYIKPVLDAEGNLYCIQKPGIEKEKNNVLLDILLIPVRIIQAIIGFISMFVRVFTGKPLINGKGKTSNGGSAAKNADEQKIFIHNHLLNVEKELKRNQKTEDSGFIPHSWRLVRFKKSTDGDFFNTQYDIKNGEELAKGVADFCITDEAVVYTNGKRIFELRFEDGEIKKKKLLNTDFCIKISAIDEKMSEAGKNKDLFYTL